MNEYDLVTKRELFDWLIHHATGELARTSVSDVAELAENLTTAFDIRGPLK